jgi:hypothetical protein
MLLWPVAPALAAPAQEPADLTALAQAGLSPETSGRYLAQNLNPARRAAPVEAKLLARLGQYGGDSLASAYLDLDKATLNKPHRDFSPEVVEQLMNDNMAAGELQILLADEAARETSALSAPQAPIRETPAVSQIAAPAASSAQTPPPAAAPAETAIPAPTRSRTAAVPPAPAERAYQDLRPGQSADPSLKLPPPPQTYDIRRPSLDGPWMGVTERELPDGHVVEVNTVGYASQVGQEVLSRPTGHQVYRYYAGNPDRPRSGADPAQEWKNREDLQIIFAPRNESR